MRSSGWIAAAVCVLFGGVVANCGTGTIGFGQDSGADGGDNDSTVIQDTGGNPFGDTGTGEAAPPCKGLQCDVQNCGSGTPTSISGTVYDPAGNNPLYNILVYIPTFPNDPLPVMTHGMSCDTCAAKIDNAMATALTDAKGHFTIKNAPVGPNIPIVVQVGKWRRKFVMPTATTACADNPYPNPTAPASRMRLPAKKSEGDMPLIAYATGCDPMDSLLKKVGIDPAEFTAEAKGGTVEVYQGNSTTINPPGSGSAYTFWNDATDMKKHDIIMNACECSPYPRNSGYANLDTYLNGGGRFFGSHYHVNFFADSTAAADLKSAATWNEWGSCGSGPYAVDTTFPKGKAMADWMQGIFPNIPYGSFTATSSCIVQDIHATVAGISQQWIYDTTTKYPGYISINTPTTKQPQDRCGRAVVTDLHVGSTGSTLEQQEAALEFMFFDLAACVQDDNSTPQPPTPN